MRYSFAIKNVIACSLVLMLVLMPSTFSSSFCVFLAIVVSIFVFFAGVQLQAVVT
jgi:hypothetical protein